MFAHTHNAENTHTRTHTQCNNASNREGFGEGTVVLPGQIAQKHLDTGVLRCVKACVCVCAQLAQISTVHRFYEDKADTHTLVHIPVKQPPLVPVC